MPLRFQLLLVAVTTALVASTAMFMPIGAAGTLFDGGLIASSGTFLLHGALPYRDYWWLYGPLGGAVAGSFTAVFGPSLLLVRILGLGALILQAIAAFELMRARTPAWAAAALAVAGACAGVTVMGLELTSWALALSIALPALAVRADGRRPLVSGVLVGLAFAARFDLGGYALVASLAWGPERRRVIAGFSLVVVPLALWMVLTAPIQSLFDQIVWFPLIGQRTFRALPLPEVLGPASALVFLSLVIAPKAILLLATAKLARGGFRDGRLAMIVTFGLLCQLQALTRADYTHQCQAALPGLIALGTAWPALFRLATRGASASVRVVAGVRFSSAVLLSAVLLLFALASVTRAQPGMLSKDDQALFAAVRTVKVNTQGDEPIFVGLGGHRHTLINDMVVYYLADRRPGVRVAMFNPGVTNTAPVQLEMIGDLKRSHTALVVTDDRWTELAETSNDSRVPGATVLDDYLAATYIPVCNYGSITILATAPRVASVRCAEMAADTMLEALGTVARR